MKESISVFLKRLSDILEFVISFILTAGIILLCLRVDLQNSRFKCLA